MHEKIEPQRLYESLAATIKEAIRSGEYEPGDKLPPERELLDTFKVSRPTLREAFRMLESENIIFSRQGGGRYIRQPLTDNLFKAVTSIRPPERQMIIHLIEARETLELKTIFLASKFITEEELDGLRGIVQNIYSLKNLGERSIPELFSLDLKFHHLVAQASRNPVYVNWLDISMQILQESRQRMLFLPKRREQLGQELQLIIEGLASRNSKLAVKSMSSHLQSIIGRLQTIPDE